MPRKIYRGSYQSQRNNNSKKKIVVIVVVVLILCIGVGVFLAFNENGIGAAMSRSVEEITQLKMQIKERDDKIADLEQKIVGYEQELATRPAPSATPIPPPNEEVSAGQPTPEPTVDTNKPKRTAKPKSTPKPTSGQPAEPQPTQEPQIPTQPPQIPTQPPQTPPMETSPTE